MAIPPPPDPGAQVSTFTITDAVVPANGVTVVQVDTFANKENANDVTIVNTSTDPITTLTIEKFGDNEGEQDVIRVDLSDFSDDFTLVLKNTGGTVQDQLYLEGLQSFADNGDGTYTATYYGSDSQLYTLQIVPEDAAVTPYYAPDNVVTGDEGAEVMGAGYSDIQGDEIDGADGDADSIFGGGGRDTINAGSGNDTVYGDYAGLVGRLAPNLPPNTYAGTPPGPAPAAEVFAFAINDANLDANGLGTLTVDAITPNETNAQDFTITDDALTESLTQITIKKGGGSDGSADIYRFDLSGFDDDFLVIIADEDTFDRLVFENVHTATDNGNGTYDLTYYGSDSALHTVTVNPDLAHVDFYLSPDSPYFYDDIIDTGSGDDLVDGGYGDDSLTGDIGNDTLIGGIGDDTLIGGDGADALYGDWDQALTAEIGPAPTATAEVLTYSIDDAAINAGDVSIVVDQISVDVNGENDVLITDDAATKAIDTITIAKLGNGDGDGEQDIFRFDLSTFDDDFTISVASEGTEDKFVFEDVYEATDNGDGTWTITYFGEDDALHTTTVTPGLAQVEIYYGVPPDAMLVQTNDVLDGGAGDDTLDGGYGNDSIDAGADNDLVSGGDGDDTILGGSGLDTITAGAGADFVDAGDGADTVDGGTGDDTLLGGLGDDTLYGGDATASVPPDRVSFSWSDVPDPNDGGQIDNNDVLNSGTQTVGSVTVDYTLSNSNATYQTEAVAVSGIDGDGSANPNSAISLEDSIDVAIDFSQEVQNVSFRLSDLDDAPDSVTIRAYDAQGNQIPFSATPGTNVTSADNDTVAGSDTFGTSTTTFASDADLGSSVLIEIPGPVARIEIEFNSPSSGTMVGSDIYFDDPATGIVGNGSDSVVGGDGDDVLIAGLGDDTLDGGAGQDIYDGTQSFDFADETFSLFVDQSGDGTATYLNDTGIDTLTGIETFLAGESVSENDTITITEGVRPDLISGFSDTAVGVFNPVLGGSGPIAFGGSGEPTLSQLLAGGYDPGTGPVSAAGTYQISGGEEDGAQVGAISFANFENVKFDVVCFAQGTGIETPEGWRAVETLQGGDLVMTQDDGPMPVLFVQTSEHSWSRDPHKNKPIRIKRGALGAGAPLQDLCLSPQHRVLLRNPVSGDEVLAPAKALTILPGVHQMNGRRAERYYHVVLERHALLNSDGVVTESFYPGKRAIRSLSNAQRAVLRPFLIMDAKSGAATPFDPVRSFEKVQQARQLLAEGALAVGAQISQPERRAKESGYSARCM